jgi:hypothetical protein
VLPSGTPCCPQLAVLAGLPVGTGIGTIFLFYHVLLFLNP